MLIDDHGLGYEHNRLREVAAQMKRDGHHLLALDYDQRANEAETVFAHFRGLGKVAAKNYLYNQLGSAEDGVRIANWLLGQGWTPPVHIPLKED